VSEIESEITPDHAYEASQHHQQGSGLRPHIFSSSSSSSSVTSGTIVNGPAGAAAAGGSTAAGAKAAAAASAGTAGAQKVWQPRQQKPGALLQLLLAVAALVLGLLLAYPSMMLQQAAVAEGST
jgi:hypothetical protein